MKHKIYSPKSLCLIILMLLFGASLMAASVYQIENEVKKLKAWLNMNPRIEDYPNAELGESDLAKRKQEIRNQINALLSSTQETYTFHDIRILGYLPERGALSLENKELGTRLYINMTEQQSEIVIANANSFKLEAIRVLNWDLEWEYRNWVLKGRNQNYQQQHEPVYNIPDFRELPEYAAPRLEILEELSMKDSRLIAVFDAFENEDYEYALHIMDHLFTLNTHDDDHLLYWMAQAYFGMGDANRAKSLLESYLRSGDAKYRLASQNLVEILERQYHVFRSISSRDLPAGMNSREGDGNFVYNHADGFLYFASQRPAEYYGKNIWRAERINDYWAVPQLVPELCSNTDEAPSSFSEDGKTLWLYKRSARQQKDYDIMISLKEDGKWQSPQAVAPLCSEWDDIDPWLHAGNLLIFSSNRPGGYGGYDLWFSILGKNGWESPQNLGPEINSPGNERAPFLDYDDKTLFFRSDGYPGFGGYDLFKCVSLAPDWKKWSLAENLGSEINSYQDQFRYYHVKGSNHAFLEQYAQGRSHGRELLVEYAPRSYWTKDKQNTATWQMDPDQRSPLTGASIQGSSDKNRFHRIFVAVVDEQGRYINPELYVSYHHQGVQYKQPFKEYSFGEYGVDVPLLPEYEITGILEGYQHYESILYPDDEDDDTLVIEMQELSMDKVFVFNNILFDYDSSVIKQESYSVLNGMAITLINNPEVRMEISGHTCNAGSKEYNQNLSLERAESVMRYLIDKGVSARRLIALGFGMDKPVTDNSTEEKRELNRRVEFKVIN